MKTYVGIAIAAVGAANVVAEKPEDLLQGLWIFEASGSAAMASRCRMSLQFVGHGRAIRTTGDLVYSTKVVFTPRSRGWILQEELEGHNGLMSCRGEPAEEVVKHLEQRAYVEIEGSTLNYFRTPDDAQPSLQFVHVKDES